MFDLNFYKNIHEMLKSDEIICNSLNKFSENQIINKFGFGGTQFTLNRVNGSHFDCDLYEKFRNIQLNKYFFYWIKYFDLNTPFLHYVEKMI